MLLEIVRSGLLRCHQAAVRLPTAVLFASLLALAASPTSAIAKQVEVGPGKAIHNPSAVPWSTLQPGDEVVIFPGSYADPLIITSQGNAGQPIVVRGEGNVVINNSVVMEGAAHVVVRGLAIRNARHSGFILRRGANYVTIRDSSVANSGLGIWIGDGSLGRHQLLNNDLWENRTHGIAIDVINLEAGEETLISGNTISRNVMHGIEINGNRYIVERNVVRDNGTGLSGTSGIHVFAKSPKQGTGLYNVIRYNITSGQKETTGQDGNGIQLDQWCDYNQVYFNISMDNDGAGIVLFDAANNLVANNTLVGNMIDRGKRHAYKADLVIASDYTKNVDHAYGNTIVNNLVYTTRLGVRPVYVDRFGASRMKMFGNNILFRESSSGPLFFWAGTSGSDIEAWNKLKPGPPDFGADPQLTDVARAKADVTAWRGLIPRVGSYAASSGIGTGLEIQSDMTGAILTPWPIGAFAGARP